MGHSLSRQKSVSPELLKPQGLYSNNKEIDLKRLKRHILDKKLAPCYRGSDYETAEVRICDNRVHVSAERSGQMFLNIS